MHLCLICTKLYVYAVCVSLECLGYKGKHSCDQNGEVGMERAYKTVEFDSS